jgi:diaminopimelate epimerase
LDLLHFSKMHGIGNDFMVVDLVTQAGSFSAETIARLADRNTGVGFDQLLLIQPPSSPEADFDYRIFNCDGSESAQCGNGARCVAKYIYDKRLSPKSSLLLRTQSGQLRTRRLSSAAFEVNLGPPGLSPDAVDFAAEAPPDGAAFTAHLDSKGTYPFGIADLGNPHAVIMLNQPGTSASTPFNLSAVDVMSLATEFTQRYPFKAGVNVGFMSIKSATMIDLRVVERGVGETRACGSGACAAAIVGRQYANLEETVTVCLPGGELSINWQGPEADVLMSGPAERVYEGRIKIPRLLEQ